MSLVLAADIGGTNSRFGIFSSDNSEPIFQISLKTSDYRSFFDLLTVFKTRQDKVPFEQIQTAVFAVAGPIVDTQNIDPPNISWNISILDVERVLGLKKAFLINDFQAQALAVLSVSRENYQEVIKGKVKEYHPKAVLGAGTGFGKSLLVPVGGGKFISLASEGGHNDFSATTDEEFEFRKFVLGRNKLTELAWDDVLSGRGLEALHEFVSSEKLPAAEVSARHLNKETKTLEMFARFYGRAARSFVLDAMALGGVYIAGGVAAKNPLIIESKFFRDSFLNSIYREILSEVPITLLAAQDSGLRGAAYEAFRLCA